MPPPQPPAPVPPPDILPSTLSGSSTCPSWIVNAPLRSRVAPGTAVLERRTSVTQQDRQSVLSILRDNIRDDYGEARPDRQHLPQLAVDHSTPESLGAFVEIHQALSRIVDSSHIRTRYTNVSSSTGGYGISYYRDPIISSSTNLTNREIQAVLLPTKPQWAGSLEAYFRGHPEAPVEAADVQIVGTLAGHPVFRVRSAPTLRIVRQTIAAFRNTSLN